MSEERLVSIVIAFGGTAFLIAYFLLRFGWVEVRVPQVQVFEVQDESGAQRLCQDSCPWRLKSGKTHALRISAENFVPKVVHTPRIKLWKTQDFSVTLFPAPEIQTLAPEDFEAQVVARKAPFEDVPGVKKIDAEGRFAITGVVKDSLLEVSIYDASGQTKVLTNIEGTFSPSLLEKLLAIDSAGLLIPEQTGIYWYDFARERTTKVYEGIPAGFSQLSVNHDGVLIVQNLRGRWQRITPDQNRETLSENLVGARFIEGDLWQLEGNRVLRNREELLSLSVDPRDFDRLWFEPGKLILQNEGVVVVVGLGENVE